MVMTRARKELEAQNAASGLKFDDFGNLVQLGEKGSAESEQQGEATEGEGSEPILPGEEVGEGEGSGEGEGDLGSTEDQSESPNGNPQRGIQPEHNWEKMAKDAQRNASKLNEENQLLKRSMESMTERLEKLEARLSAGPKDESQNQNQNEDDDPEELKDYPEFKQAIQKTVKKEVSKFREEKKVEDEADRARNSFISKVESVHKDFGSIVNSHEFVEWLKVQKTPVRKVMTDTFDGGYTSDDVTEVISSYKATLKPTAKPSVNQPQAGIGKTSVNGGATPSSGRPASAPADIYSKDEMADVDLLGKKLYRVSDPKVRKEILDKYDRSYAYYYLR